MKKRTNTLFNLFTKLGFITFACLVTFYFAACNSSEESTDVTIPLESFSECLKNFRSEQPSEGNSENTDTFKISLSVSGGVSFSDSLFTKDLTTFYPDQQAASGDEASGTESADRQKVSSFIIPDVPVGSKINIKAEIFYIEKDDSGLNDTAIYRGENSLNVTKGSNQVNLVLSKVKQNQNVIVVTQNGIKAEMKQFNNGVEVLPETSEEALIFVDSVKVDTIEFTVLNPEDFINPVYEWLINGNIVECKTEKLVFVLAEEEFYKNGKNSVVVKITDESKHEYSLTYNFTTQLKTNGVKPQITCTVNGKTFDTNKDEKNEFAVQLPGSCFGDSGVSITASAAVAAGSNIDDYNPAYKWTYSGIGTDGTKIEGDLDFDTFNLKMFAPYTPINLKVELSYTVDTETLTNENSIDIYYAFEKIELSPVIYKNGEKIYSGSDENQTYVTPSGNYWLLDFSEIEFPETADDDYVNAVFDYGITGEKAVTTVKLTKNSVEQGSSEQGGYLNNTDAKKVKFCPTKFYGENSNADLYEISGTKTLNVGDAQLKSEFDYKFKYKLFNDSFISLSHDPYTGEFNSSIWVVGIAEQNPETTLAMSIKDDGSVLYSGGFTTQTTCTSYRIYFSNDLKTEDMTVRINETDISKIEFITEDSGNKRNPWNYDTSHLETNGFAIDRSYVTGETANFSVRFNSKRASAEFNYSFDVKITGLKY